MGRRGKGRSKKKGKKLSKKKNGKNGDFHAGDSQGGGGEMGGRTLCWKPIEPTGKHHADSGLTSHAQKGEQK